jgi:hypothetical protein
MSGTMMTIFIHVYELQLNELKEQDENDELLLAHDLFSATHFFYFLNNLS